MSTIQVTTRLQIDDTDTDKIVKEEGFEPDDIADMRREIREKINRIDSQYAQINLLKVLGVGRKVATHLWQAAKSKK